MVPFAISNRRDRGSLPIFDATSMKIS